MRERVSHSDGSRRRYALVVQLHMVQIAQLLEALIHICSRN